MSFDLHVLVIFCRYKSEIEWWDETENHALIRNHIKNMLSYANQSIENSWKSMKINDRGRYRWAMKREKEKRDET